jgi:hypothetical protein
MYRDERNLSSERYTMFAPDFSNFLDESHTMTPTITCRRVSIWVKHPF